MISLQSLSHNLIPNVYVKNISLSSKYDPKVKVNNAKRAGYYDPNNPYPDKVPALSEDSLSSLTLSMKFPKTADQKSQHYLLQLLHNELSEYLKIYIHQVTDSTLYETLLKENKAASLTKNYGTDINKNPSITTKKYVLKDILHFAELGISNFVQKMPEQTLDDGTILSEAIINLNFNFKNDASFLAYLAVPVIEHPELLKHSDIVLGKVTADILILNSKFQNEGLVFTIAPSPNLSATTLAKFGKPGDMWTGPVHMHENRFMAGAEHTSDPHPQLDYQIVPVNKFIDNRVGDKIERNVLNITQTLEKVNSSITRYKNSAINLLDFESYKKTSYISDIHLSQGTGDEFLNINGFFTIDKLGLIKENSAFPFIFDNIEMAFKSDKDKKQKLIDKLLKTATRERLSFFSNDSLIEGADSGNGFSVESKGEIIKTKQKPYGLAHTTFCIRNKHNSTTRDFDIRVEVDYKDPTVEYVKRILQKVSFAKSEIDKLIKYLDISKSNASGLWEPSYDPITQRITDSAKQKLSEDTPVFWDFSDSSANGRILAIESIAIDSEVYAYFYVVGHGDVHKGNQSYNFDRFRSYIRNLSNINTATADSLLLLSKFLSNLQSQIEYSLDSVGAKKTKSDAGATANLYTKSKTQGNVFSARSNRIIKTSQSNKITTSLAGYDFTGHIIQNERFLGRTNDSFVRVPSSDYRTNCEDLTFSLTNLEKPDQGYKFAIALMMNDEITPKGITLKQPVYHSAYSYLTIPVESIKSCVVLPKTVVSMNSIKVNIENIFANIVKYNNLFYENQISPGTKPSISHKDVVRKDYNTILQNLFDAESLVFEGLNGSFSTETPEETAEPAPAKKIPAAAGKGNSKDFSAGFSNPLDPPVAPPKEGGLTSDPYMVPETLKPLEETWSSLNSNNFLIASLLSKLLMSQKKTLAVPAKKSNFTPYFTTGEPLSLLEGIVDYYKAHSVGPVNILSNKWHLSIPMPILVLAPQDLKSTSTSGVFNDYLNGNVTYMDHGTINPLLLCYYWFIHQNIVKVEFLDGFEEGKDMVTTKNKTNPYQVGPKVEVNKRNVKKPVWKLINTEDLNALQQGEKMMCRVTRYNYPFYIDKTLIKNLDLPLLNNYFIIEGT